jgi:hypothetical protein
MSTTEQSQQEHQMEERLGQVGARIDELVAGIGATGESLRKSVAEHLGAARARREELQADLDRLHEAKAKALDEYRTKVEAAEAEMNATIAIARAQLDVDLAKDRDDFVAAVRAEMDAWLTRIEQLKVRARSVPGESHEQFDAALDQLRARRDAVQRLLEELATASAEAWSTFKERVRRALDDVGAGVEGAAVQLV